MPTKMQPTPTVVINARIDFVKKAFEPYAYYITIVHCGHEFYGEKPYRFHANAVRFAKKMGFNVVEA